MKTLKIISVLLVVLFVSAFAAGSVLARGEDLPVPGGALPLPVEVQALVAALVGYLVTQGLKSLSKLLGSDLGGWIAVITAAAVTTLVYFLQALLSAVPVQAQPFAVVGLSLLVSILGAFGFHYSVKLPGGKSL